VECPARKGRPMGENLALESLGCDVAVDRMYLKVFPRG
jgi:hypothetical protein